MRQAPYRAAIVGRLRPTITSTRMKYVVASTCDIFHWATSRCGGGAPPAAPTTGVESALCPRARVLASVGIGRSFPAARRHAARRLAAQPHQDASVACSDGRVVIGGGDGSPHPSTPTCADVRSRIPTSDPMPIGTRMCMQVAAGVL
jgi:hypothetical protein